METLAQSLQSSPQHIHIPRSFVDEVPNEDHKRILVFTARQLQQLKKLIKTAVDIAHHEDRSALDRV